jgi:membrane associated rhomboid family serine protease
MSNDHTDTEQSGLPAIPETQSLTELYASAYRAECEERAFILAAVGITAVIDSDTLSHRLSVEPALAATAAHHLDAWDRERRAAQRPMPASATPRVHAGAWLGCVAYVAVLLGVAALLSTVQAPVASFARGTLEGAAVQSGQWWRAWTALTLHWDALHLIANIGAGVWFGLLAARQVGVGTAWLLIVTGAAAANLFDALLGPPSYVSAGASTMVFAALGLLAAHSWRSRLYLPQRWVLRWAPLVGGVVLLGWFGSAGEGTDLVAHALGFCCGGLLGAAVAVPAIAVVFERLPQWLSGAAALGSLVLAWWCALR